MILEVFLDKITQYKRKKTNAKKFKKKNQERDFKQSLYSDQKWRKFRFRFLGNNPYCFTCGAKSNVVDHFRPHKGNIELFYDPHNMIPLCKSCHNYVSVKFDKYKNPKLEDKAKWVEMMREKNNLKFPIKFTTIEKTKGNK